MPFICSFAIAIYRTYYVHRLLYLYQLALTAKEKWVYVTIELRVKSINVIGPIDFFFRKCGFSQKVNLFPKKPIGNLYVSVFRV